MFLYFIATGCIVGVGLLLSFFKKQQQQPKQLKDASSAKHEQQQQQQNVQQSTQPQPPQQLQPESSTPEKKQPTTTLQPSNDAAPLTTATKTTSSETPTPTPTPAPEPEPEPAQSTTGSKIRSRTVGFKLPDEITIPESPISQPSNSNNKSAASDSPSSNPTTPSPKSAWAAALGSAEASSPSAPFSPSTAAAIANSRPVVDRRIRSTTLPAHFNRAGIQPTYGARVLNDDERLLRLSYLVEKGVVTEAEFQQKVNSLKKVESNIAKVVKASKALTEKKNKKQQQQQQQQQQQKQQQESSSDDDNNNNSNNDDAAAKNKKKIVDFLSNEPKEEKKKIKPSELRKQGGNLFASEAAASPSITTTATASAAAKARQARYATVGPQRAKTVGTSSASASASAAPRKKKTALDIDPAVEDKISQIFSQVQVASSSVDWAVFKIEHGTNKLDVVSSGTGGAAQLADHLKDDQANFIILKLRNPQDRDQEQQQQQQQDSKVAFVSWLGPNVGGINVARSAGHRTLFVEYCKKSLTLSGEFQAFGHDELDEAAWIRKVFELPCTASTDAGAGAGAGADVASGAPASSSSSSPAASGGTAAGTKKQAPLTTASKFKKPKKAGATRKAPKADLSALDAAEAMVKMDIPTEERLAEISAAAAAAAAADTETDTNNDNNKAKEESGSKIPKGAVAMPGRVDMSGILAARAALKRVDNNNNN